MNRLSFKWRSVLPVVLVLLIGFSIMIVYINTSVSGVFTTVNHEWMTASALQLANHCSNEISEMLTAVHSLSHSLQSAIINQNTSREAWINILKKIALENPSVYAIYMYLEPNAFDGRDADFRNVDYHDESGIFAPYVRFQDGKYIIETSTLAEHQSYPYYQMVRSASEEIMTQPYRDADDAPYIVTTAVPIIVDGINVGFIAADYNFTVMNSELANIRVLNLNNDNRIVDVMGIDGTIAASTREANLSKNALRVMLPRTLEGFTKVLSSKQVGIFDGVSSVFGEECYYVAAPFTVGDTGAYLVTMMLLPKSLADSTARQMTLATSAFGIVSLLVTAIVLYMIINSSSKTIIFLNEQLIVASDAVLSASTQIAAASDTLAHGGVQQAAGIEETSATMSQTALMVQTTTENTRKALLLSEDASQAAERGYRLVSELVASMEELSQSSDEIGRIIKTIDEIAFQTNILALNAAVEAARAGEEGRGFAVVAAEVGTLAQRSAEAAKNTAAIIERNLDLSRRGVDSSIEAGAALGNITGKNNEVNEVINRISVSGNEQARSVEQIHIALSQMEDVTQSNAAVAEESSAASNELKIQSEGLERLAAELSQLVYGINASQMQIKSSAASAAQGWRQLQNGSVAALGDSRSRIVSPNEIIPLDKSDGFS